MKGELDKCYAKVFSYENKIADLENEIEEHRRKRFQAFCHYFSIFWLKNANSTWFCIQILFSHVLQCMSNENLSLSMTKDRKKLIKICHSQIWHIFLHSQIFADFSSMFFFLLQSIYHFCRYIAFNSKSKLYKITRACIN